MLGFRKFLAGINIIPKTPSTVSSQGDLDVSSGDGKLNYHNGVSASPVLTEAHAAVVTNKTISGSTNTITDIPASVLTGTVPLANGGTGQTTQQAALNAIAGAVTSGLVLRGNGTNVSLSAIQASDVPTLNQNTTGTAANITDTVNTSLTTLSSLSLPGSQVSGDIAGNAANVTGTVAISKGGTGQTSRIPAFNALSPLGTNKGGLITSDGTDNIVLPVGTDGQLLVADSSQSSGLAYKYISGVKNYITNGDAEATTTGWAPYANTPGALPVTGTGGTATAFAFSRNTTNPLRGVASFLIAKTNTNGQGQGVSYDFTIDAADKAKVLSISFDYQISSGTYVDGDLTCYIYDVTNSQIIQPAGFTIQNATVNMKQIASFQSASNSTSYRLIFHMASTSALGYSIRFDNVIVGPQIVTNGAAITDFESFTSNITGTISDPTKGTVIVDSGFYRRVGDKVEIQYNYIQTTGGSAGSGDYLFSLPSGLVIDSSKITINTTGSLMGTCGVGSYTDNSGFTYSFNVAVHDSTHFWLIDLVNGSAISNAHGSLANANVKFSFTASVPIQGWSSNVQLSSDTDTRVVAARGNNSAATSMINSTDTLVPFSSTFDTHGALASSGVYTVPVAGKYKISVRLMLDLTSAFDTSVGRTFTTKLFKNGSLVSVLGRTEVQKTSASYYSSQGSDVVDCVAGDQLSIYAIQNIPGSGNVSLLNDPVYNYLDIERISGPSIVAANESVVFRAENGAGSTLFTSPTNIPFPTTIIDSHNAWNGTQYVVPVSGKYRVSCFLMSTNVSAMTAPGNTFDIRLSKNGNTGNIIAMARAFSTTTQYYPANGSDIIQANSGDTLELTGYFALTGSNSSLINSADYNYITVERVGN